MKKLPKRSESSSTEKINPRAIQKSYMDRIEEEVESQGVTFFEPDVNLNINPDYLQLPSEITEVTSKELGEYLNAFTQQKMYYRTLLGRTGLMLEEAQREYNLQSHNDYEVCSQGKLSETAKERIINSRPKVLPYYQKLRDISQKYNLLEIAISNIEDAIFLISREVSRRGADFDNENRNYSVNG